MVILNNWERQQVFRRGDPGCPLCGLNWTARDGTYTGMVEPWTSWCADKTACSERWLKKFLSGRIPELATLTLLGKGPQQQGVFEVCYHLGVDPGQTDPKKRVLMPEVRPGGDRHRRSEHYHLVEFGEDITDSFAP